MAASSLKLGSFTGLLSGCTHRFIYGYSSISISLVKH
ncbi:hypothetical protein ACP70R_029900 [Stipagrostis hirtigluma subsp. patula]